MLTIHSAAPALTRLATFFTVNWYPWVLAILVFSYDLVSIPALVRAVFCTSLLTVAVKCRL